MSSFGLKNVDSYGLTGKATQLNPQSFSQSFKSSSRSVASSAVGNGLGSILQAGGASLSVASLIGSVVDQLKGADTSPAISNSEISLNQQRQNQYRSEWSNIAVQALTTLASLVAL